MWYLPERSEEVQDAASEGILGVAPANDVLMLINFEQPLRGIKNDDWIVPRVKQDRAQPYSNLEWTLNQPTTSALECRNGVRHRVNQEVGLDWPLVGVENELCL